MIKSITVTNFLGESLRLEIARPEASGFVVQSIKGLDPGKSSINVIESSIYDGSIFNSARLATRNIVISLAYLWTDSIEKARYRTYKYFPLKKPIDLLIETDTRKAKITGYVESNEPDIFNSQEGGDISIICPDPFFYSAGDDGIHSTVFSGIQPCFEFPFCNDSLSEKQLLFSYFENKAEKSVVYTGDADIGITIVIHAATGPATNITIYNTGTHELMSLLTTMEQGDDIYICTERGNKSITRLRNGESTNIVNCLSKNSDWFQLVRGNNIFAYIAEEGSSNLEFKIENRIAYEGV